MFRWWIWRWNFELRIFRHSNLKFKLHEVKCHLPSLSIVIVYDCHHHCHLHCQCGCQHIQSTLLPSSPLLSLLSSLLWLLSLPLPFLLLSMLPPLLSSLSLSPSLPLSPLLRPPPSTRLSLLAPPHWHCHHFYNHHHLLNCRYKHHLYAITFTTTNIMILYKYYHQVFVTIKILLIIIF